MQQPLPSGTLAARMVLRVVEFCGRRGHDPSQLCSSVGVSLESLNEPGARVPYDVVVRLGERALEWTKDEDFGLHLAEDVRETQDFDVGMLSLMASPTVRAALERFVAKQRYWGDGERATVYPVPEGLVIRYALSGLPSSYARHANECAMAEIALGVRVLTGQPLCPAVVRFPHPRPARVGEHARLLRCPVEFDAPHTEVVFDKGVLEATLPHANAMFLGIFERQVEAALARLPDVANTSHAVRETARAALAAGGCSLEGTARAMAMSSRTLQRRLQGEGTSFADIVDALRRELAVAYLQRQMPIAEVAMLLGYSDVTAFHHAFRRWTGASPSRYQP